MAQGRMALPGNSNGIEKSSPDTAKFAIVQGLDLAGSIYSKELAGVEVEFWHEILGRYKPEHISRAFKRHCAESIYFPKPAEIREVIAEFIRDEQPSPAEIIRRQLAEPSRQDAENQK